MNFYAYHLMLRQNSINVLLHCKNLFNQFVVDMYAKIESERLRYIQFNQNSLRADNYIHLQDAMMQDHDIDPNNVGQRIILPSSFVNSPRYLQQYVQDTFAYVRQFGKPDYFITFTCNPSWLEISDNLFDNQVPTDRDDIKARVFRQKVIRLVKILTKGHVLGESIAFVYSIEWQKRGLPHIHLLLWCRDKLRSNQIDCVISAEIPDPDVDPLLNRLVVKHMIHGPCGERNPSAPCMKNGKCEKGFPKKFTPSTISDNKGYPLYRRKSPEDGGFEAAVTVRNKGKIVVDNTWVVPYCPMLLKMFQAHLNVECCNSVEAIKYIMKYIMKGSDHAIFGLNKNHLRENNEVETYQSGQY